MTHLILRPLLQVIHLPLQTLLLLPLQTILLLYLQPLNLLYLLHLLLQHHLHLLLQMLVSAPFISAAEIRCCIEWVYVTDSQVCYIPIADMISRCSSLRWSHYLSHLVWSSHWPFCMEGLPVYCILPRQWIELKPTPVQSCIWDRMELRVFPESQVWEYGSWKHTSAANLWSRTASTWTQILQTAVNLWRQTASTWTQQL